MTDQIGAILEAIRDAKHQANQLTAKGDEYEAGELLQRVESLNSAIETLKVVKALGAIIRGEK